MATRFEREFVYSIEEFEYEGKAYIAKFLIFDGNDLVLKILHQNGTELPVPLEDDEKRRDLEIHAHYELFNDPIKTYAGNQPYLAQFGVISAKIPYIQVYEMESDNDYVHISDDNTKKQLKHMLKDFNKELLDMYEPRGYVAIRKTEPINIFFNQDIIQSVLDGN